MASMEEDFPRGGSVTKPTSSKKEVQRTDVDNLFQVKPIYFLVLLYLSKFLFFFKGFLFPYTCSSTDPIDLVCLSSQSNEEAETKKRKGALKDDSKKIKKIKTGKGKEENLTLNKSVKCVEILHIKVIHLLRTLVH